MTICKAKALLPFSAVLALAGCAGEGGYPSLAKRPAEVEFEAAANGGRIGGSAAPAAPAPGVATSQQAVSPELTARIAELGEAAGAAHQRFTAKRAEADRLTRAASGAAMGSESWSQATVALAELESARSDAMVSLGELDRLYAEGRVAAAERNDGDDGGAIAAVRDKVTAWVADEDAVLAELAGRVKG